MGCSGPLAAWNLAPLGNIVCTCEWACRGRQYRRVRSHYEFAEAEDRWLRMFNSAWRVNTTTHRGRDALERRPRDRLITRDGPPLELTLLLASDVRKAAPFKF